MDLSVLGAIAILLLALFFVGVAVYYLLAPREGTNIKNLMDSQRSTGTTRRATGVASKEDRFSDEELEKIKEDARKQLKADNKISFDDKLFQAGMLSKESKREFARYRIILPIAGGILGAILGLYFISPLFALVGSIFFVFVGLQAPFSIIDRKIKYRHEDMMYYLPLVIEQVVIGVSSSLDVGPCLQRIVAMADERDTHNVVTELLKIVQFYVKSGVSQEDALVEVGKRTGHTELKHTFMSLSQVSKHGGEVTRQLQELADAVAAQKETKIDAKIKKLELEATGPVGLVFLAFLAILLVGFGIQIKGALG